MRMKNKIRTLSSRKKQSENERVKLKSKTLQYFKPKGSSLQNFKRPPDMHPVMELIVENARYS